MSNDEQVEQAREFVTLLMLKPQCVLEALNIILEKRGADFELCIKRSNIQSKYEEARRELPKCPQFDHGDW